MKVKLRQLFFKDAEAGQTMDIERRLTNGGLGQLVCWTLERRPREFKAKSIIGMFENIAGDRERGGQILAHADRLRTLAGKQQRNSFVHRVILRRRAVLLAAARSKSAAWARDSSSVNGPLAIGMHASNPG